MQTITAQNVWVNILSKGVITLPKKIRERVGIKEGDVASVYVEGNRIIIEPRETIAYRTFTPEQIARWEKEDRLPVKYRNRIEELWPELP